MAIYEDKKLDLVFHALGDRTRREMVSLLAQRGVCTAGELGEPFDIAQPTASKHLRVLERAGLVKRDVEGRVHRMKLDPLPLQEAQQWIDKHRDFWRGRLDALAEFMETLEKRKEPGDG